MFDASSYRLQFPVLRQTINGSPLIYFDNASTTQKPETVIERLRNYFENENANVHRGVHTLSQRATDEFEKARKVVQRFIHAANDYEIIFTKGTTDSINLVATTFSEKFLDEGDEVVVSVMEHHSNLVPWQMACEKKNASLRALPVNEKGELIWEEAKNLLSAKTKLVAITHISNSLGTINPIKEIISDCHSQNIPVLIDGAQAAPHFKVDVQELDADFYCFSGHKIFGPTGIGVLYGKEKWLNELPPYQGGGNMIKRVTLAKTTYNELPHKFEAGTPHIAGVIGLATALSWFESIQKDPMLEYENKLLTHFTNLILELPDVKIYGESKEKTTVISFNVKNQHPYDVGVLLDQMGIAVRTGHHCNQPLMDFFGIPGTVRASLALYNTEEEIDSFIIALKKAIQMLKA